MSDASKRAPDDELSFTVRKAQDDLARAVSICKLQNDPLRHSFDAMSAAIGAMHDIYRAGARSLTEAQSSTLTTERIAKAQMEALKPELLSALRRGGRTVADACFVRLDRRMAMLFSLGLLVAVLAGGLIDHFLIGTSISRAPAACWVQDGKTLCQPGVWLGSRP